MTNFVHSTATALKNESIRQLCAQGKTKKEAKDAYKVLLEHARNDLPNGHRVKVFFIENWDQGKVTSKAYYDWEFTSNGRLKSSLPYFKESKGKRIKDYFFEPMEGATKDNSLGRKAAASVRKECIKLISVIDGISTKAASECYDKLFAMAKAESGLDIWALDCAYNAATGGLDYKYWV